MAQGLSRVLASHMEQESLKTILLVEDDQDARTILKEAFEAVGHRVIVARHGAEGVHVARRTHPDLILMDLRMPVMDGVAALGYLRADSETRKIPVWAVSAHLTAQAEELLPRGGFDRRFQRPIDIKDIVAEVERHFGYRTPPGPEREIDTWQKERFRGGIA